MKLNLLLSFIAGTAPFLGGTGIVLVDARSGGRARGKLYSKAAVRRFCSRAQKIIGSTDVQSTNVIYDTVEGFQGSDALPYQDTGTDLPLTTRQYELIEPYPIESDGSYERIISCKMKDEQEIQAFVDPTAGSGGTCKDVTDDLVADVVASLTRSEARLAAALGYTVVVEEDINLARGSVWALDFPFDIACLDGTQSLKIQSRALIVDRSFFPWPFPSTPPSFYGPEKTGVHYCHFPGAEYLREVLIGNLSVPNCALQKRSSSSSITQN